MALQAMPTVISGTKQNGRGEKRKTFAPGPDSVLFLALFQVTVPKCQKVTGRRNAVGTKMFGCRRFPFAHQIHKLQMVPWPLVLSEVPARADALSASPVGALG